MTLATGRRCLKDSCGTLFTTLTRGEVIHIQSGKEEDRLLIDKVEPEGDRICIVDTDLEVGIEALNEEQARETLKKRLEKSSGQAGRKEGRSEGGSLTLDQSLSSDVAPGDYLDGLGPLKSSGPRARCRRAWHGGSEKERQTRVEL